MNTSSDWAPANNVPRPSFPSSQRPPCLCSNDRAKRSEVSNPFLMALSPVYVAKTR